MRTFKNKGGAVGVGQLCLLPSLDVQNAATCTTVCNLRAGLLPLRHTIDKLYRRHFHL